MFELVKHKRINKEERNDIVKKTTIIFSTTSQRVLRFIFLFKKWKKTNRVEKKKIQNP